MHVLKQQRQLYYSHKTHLLPHYEVLLGTGFYICYSCFWLLLDTESIHPIIIRITFQQQFLWKRLLIIYQPESKSTAIFYWKEYYLELYVFFVYVTY
jgi:hypothetical protein